MLRKNYLHTILAFITILTLLSGLQNDRSVSAAPSMLSTPTATPTITQTVPPAATQTSTPVVQTDAEPQAWLDGTIDVEQFAPDGSLIVHFSTPMSPESSPNPILMWPVMNGISSWDSNHTILTFKPDSLFDSKKTYTGFLDPALRPVNGKEITDSPEWILHIQKGPRIQSVSPQPGSLEKRSRVIEVQFDRQMKPTTSGGTLLIEPPIPFELKWKSDRILQIALQQPLEPNQRYDLTLNGGRNENALFAADGAYLTEDYRWFYWQESFAVDVDVLNAKTIGVKFNYVLDQEKSGLPFSISPQLDGEWKWFSSQEIRFTAKESIPASKEFTLSLAQPLLDSNGFETSSIPTIAFAGVPPISLATRDIKKNTYTDSLFADLAVESIRIEFDSAVDHASAEKAFSLNPSVPGKFQWEKVSDGSKEILVYALSELLSSTGAYTVKIDSTVLDAQGNRMIVQPYEQSFLTNAWSYLTPSFGESGDNIQSVDANGPRRIQFSGGEGEISFAAYHFDLIDFAKLYADHYHYRQGGTNVRDIPIPTGLEPSAIWTNITTREAGDGKIVETVLPSDLPSGLYVLNLRNHNVLYDQMFLVLTQNTLMVKNDGDDLFVWLTNINGENVPDAEIRVYSTSGEKVREGKTDENGQYRVSISEGSEPMLVSARVEEPGLSGDVTLAGFGGWNSSFPYSDDYGDRSYLLPDGQPYLIYLYTERPIYRPGQVVNFKAILRKDDDVHFTLPDEGTPVKIRLLDARGNTVESMELLTNRFGSVNNTVRISEGAMLGTYEIEADVHGVITSQTFKVEDYRKPDYQIKLTSLQPEKGDKYVSGEEMSVQVNAAYYFGEPLANTKLDVQFYYIWPLKTTVTGSLVTDENGVATLSFPAPYNPDFDHYYYGDYDSRYQSVRMEVSANDGSNQTVTGVYYFSVYPASEQLSLNTDGYYVQPGQAFSVTTKVFDLSDQPVAGHTLTLATSAWNRTNYKFDRVEQNIQLQTDAAGLAKQEIKLSAGYHQLTLTGEDPQGHKMEVRRWVYVFKSRQDWFQRSESEFLMISADRDSYKPYETARFAIESTFSGPALLTFERGSVINTKMVELTAPLTIFETEIIPEHAPNVYVTVNAWQPASQDVGRYRYWYSNMTSADSYLRLAKTQIQVDSTAKALDISIVTDKEAYAPGEKLNAVIQVSDSDGKPVLAELSLAVVDEAIFALASDPAANIFDAFYGPRGHSVLTFDSMAPTRIIMTGGQGGGGDEIPPAVRSDFPDTSAWLPVIETDASGKATVSIDLPDNTTSWRLSVKAITLNHKVGQAIANIETKKDVFVRPVLPRVLTHGDQATLTAFIHNTSAETQTMTVNLAAPGLEIRSQNNEQISLKAGEVLPVGWQVRVQSAKPTEVTITAEGAAGVLDAIRLPLQLQPAAVRDFQNQSGQFSGTLSLGLLLPEVERDTSEVRLTLNRSMSGTLLNGLEFLTGYPYGCVEQTMSRALPNAVVGRAAGELGVGGPEMGARLEPLIDASIQRLYGLQHSDGGWGWWTDDVSDPYQTAWVLFGLGVMDNSGYSIEPRVMDKAATWLKDEMSRNTEMDIRTRAYALFSMAQSGRGDLEKTQALISSSIYELDPFSQAALALALHDLGEGEQAQTILDMLSTTALEKDQHVYWPQPSYDGEYHSKTMASSVRTTALVLWAYTEIDPDNALVPGIVRYLADERQGIYGWGTTNETSFTILALTEYLITQENKSGNTPYEVLVNGNSIATGILEVGNSSAGIEVPLDQLNQGLNTLVVTTDGDEPVYFDLATKYDLLQGQVEASGTIQITRKYTDPKTKVVLETFKAGQLVKVELRVQIPENVYFLAVEDYLPGGFEALNEGLSATNQVSLDYWGYESYNPFYWEDYGYNYKEIRGNRVVFFITSLEKGARTFTYYARATTSGTFTALPAQAYAMYDPNLWGRSENANVQIDK